VKRRVLPDFQELFEATVLPHQWYPIRWQFNNCLFLHLYSECMEEAWFS
jgi:hypothetical protein